MQRPLLGFDTSAINALRKDGPEIEPLLAAFDAAYAIRLNGTALDEIVAHSIPAERERLRKLCRRLLANGEGDVWSFIFYRCRDHDPLGPRVRKRAAV